MHLPCAGDFQPFARIRSCAKRHVDLDRRLGEWEVGRAETHLQIGGFKEFLQEGGVHGFEIGKAHGFGNPQTFDLMEHRRMGGIGVHAVGAPRRDDFDRATGFELA